MKWFLSFSIIFLLLFSCNKKTAIQKEALKTKTVANFEINGTFENFYPKKVYLNKIIENRLYPIDSAIVLKNKFNFKGIVTYPERFAFTYESSALSTILIIENKSFQIQLNGRDLQEPIIINSPLNTELEVYKTNSKNIFKKIDFLFPQFQKARLENDADKLFEIEKKMKAIENEFTKFTFNYIQQNNTSFISAMLLRDQLKVSKIDSLKISKLYKNLSSEVKNSPDALIVADYLKLH
ncbi:DUF4369 domain-containing protein [Lutibacter sp. TH_r2]|uniref:DUF4369 domain-containing protein n=1 Tax=Lutibacter sp. TH_r2 TaxID=3082083 RepID=UPI002954950E|nr:DUF4369 domain-containing protein [Lutibacter sp. TH_r2]MDV7188075.1 DUF4369 domain-containing protein [Lutibacter sp. TH_r2]